MSDIAVDAVVSLKLKLPPESAAIIGEIIIGDRVFTPSGEHQIEIPTQEFGKAVERLEKEQAEPKTKPSKKKASAPAKSKGGGKLEKRECANPECGKLFTPTHRLQKKCSDACKKRFAALYARNHYANHHKPSKTEGKPSFVAAGATPDTPVGIKPLDIGGPTAPRSYGRQGD